MSPISAPTSRYTAQTPYLTGVHNTMFEAIPAFPKSICYLVDSYVNVALFALEPLEFDSSNHVINPEVRASIKNALVSTVCGQLIKATLFRHKEQHKKYEPYQNEFIKLSKEIVAARENVNLDGIILSGVNFSEWNLTDLSARLVSLHDCDFNWANLTRADFSHARMEDVGFAGTILNETRFGSVIFDKVDFYYASVREIYACQDLISLCYVESEAGTDRRPSFRYILNTIYTSNPSRSERRELRSKIYPYI